MKVGIMGGTFDPIHNGHLMLGEYALEQFSLDRVWFMPNGNPPHKQANQVGRTDALHREEMVRLAIQGKPGFFLQDYETKRTEISYSYQTMEYFKKCYSDYEFYFIIGADSLVNIERWVHPERLLKTCGILAACRDEMSDFSVMEDRIHYLNGKYEADIQLLKTPLFRVSSSELREKMQRSESIQGLVPDSVIDYIAKHHLYENI